MNRIAVIIITKDRPEQLFRCLNTLKKCSLKYFELIIIDQSSKKLIDKQTIKILKSFSNIKYKKSNEVGKSKGLNLAISLCSAQLVAFTDDDCIVDEFWLQNIYETFQKDKKIIGIFGKTIPYQQEKHKRLTCPSTFDHDLSRYITKPSKHWEKIGFGNNMAWRKSFFEKFGGFKEWLGPGSIGSNAEDAEIALRALINNQIIYYNSKVIVEHNKWLTETEFENQKLSYTCGEMACYWYIYRSGINLGFVVVKNNWLFIKNRLTKITSFGEFIKLIRIIVFQIRGLIVAELEYRIEMQD